MDAAPSVAGGRADDGWEALMPDLDAGAAERAPAPPRAPASPRAAAHPRALGTSRALAPSRAAAPPRLRGRERARHLWQAAAHGVRSRAGILAVIAAGGALGSLARWGLSQALAGPAGAFAWGTFTANVTGCLVLGALMVLIGDVWPPSRYVRPFLGVGVLGGYTTFSSYMLDIRTELVTGHAATAGVYLLATLAAGLAAVWAGVAGARGAVRVARARARGHAGRRGHQHTVSEPAGPPALPRDDRSPR